MNSKLTKFAQVAALGLAITFTFSCGDGLLSDSNSSSSGTTASSSSSLARSSSGISSSGTSSSGTKQSSSSSLASSSSSSLQSSSSKNVIVYGKPITDARDGQTYQTVVIGSQTWMAKNLNYEAEGAKCYGEGARIFSADSIAKNCEIYGRLYSWKTAMSACPDGWHLPYYAEWKQLVDYVGTDYTKLRAASSDWNSPGTDDYGFAALPGGYFRDYFGDKDFSSIYSLGMWWSATEYRVDVAYDMWSNVAQNFINQNPKENLLSVRCVQVPSGCTPADNTDTQYCLGRNGTMKEYGSMTDDDGKTYKTVVIGEQTWMAENFDYDEKGGYSKCYDNKPENCEKYGRLYDWLAATEVCPNGWHLPSDAEWATLKGVVSNINELRARSRTDGVDNYGFSALGGGYGYSSSFSGVSSDYWWSATEKNATNAIYWYLSLDFGLYNGDNKKTNFYPVRCLKD